MKRTILSLGLLAAAVSLAVLAIAAPPTLVNYQGVLTDADGVPISGAHDLTFGIFSDSVGYALWVETHPQVPIDAGLFNVILGSFAELPDHVFSSSERWLEIIVDGADVIVPRIRMTSVPWALRAAVADSALSSAGGADNDWIVTGDDMHAAVTGNVGIGTSNPLTKLDFGLDQNGKINGVNVLYGSTYAGKLTFASYAAGTGGNSSYMSFWTSDGVSREERLRITEGGRVGIGTTTPARLVEIYDDPPIMRLTSPDVEEWPTIELKGYDSSRMAKLGKITFLDQHDTEVAFIRYMGYLDYGHTYGLTLYAGGSISDVLRLERSGRVGIGTFYPDETLDVRGTAKCEVLKISGGADLAEPFDVQGDDVEPGTVVSIDPTHPGQLKPAEQAYDRCVAGVVSGAGGIDAGLLMGKEGSVADGEHPIALTGRVYCRATAANGAIQPGDLLTTSDISGHAMKVTDHTRAQGAVIGKAMTSLAEGHGLVLVLVSLQ